MISEINSLQCGHVTHPTRHLPFSIPLRDTRICRRIFFSYILYVQPHHDNLLGMYISTQGTITFICMITQNINVGAMNTPKSCQTREIGLIECVGDILAYEERV